MKNYISINGEVKELTDEQVSRFLAEEKDAKKKIMLSEVEVGDIFKIGPHEFIVLEQSGDTTSVIRNELLQPRSEFGNINNFDGSTVELRCYGFANEIASLIDKENIIEHTVDLTSNDGLKDYGQIKCRASLLTADRYRRYVGILDKFKPTDWWWLATPFSTKKHDGDSWILCVSPSGCIDINHYFNVGGVRPFCILKSTIFVSK